MAAPGARDDGRVLGVVQEADATDHQPADLELLLPLVADADACVRAKLAAALSRFNWSQQRGRAADVLLRMLDDGSPEVRVAAMTGVPFGRVDPRIEERLLAMTDEPDSRHDAICSGLCGFPVKSPRVVAALLDCIADVDDEVAERARAGLRGGVPAESYATVVDAALRILSTRSEFAVQRACLQLLRQYGQRAQIPALEAFAAHPEVHEQIRADVHQVLEWLRDR